MRKMFSLKQLQEIADSEVKNLVEGGTLENAKPIYYHPISLVSETGGGLIETRVQMLILDNNSTAYTPTTLLTKLQDLLDAGAIININGYYIKNSTIFNAYLISKVSSEYRVYGNDTTGRNYVTLSEILASASSITDGVNKIN